MFQLANELKEIGYTVDEFYTGRINIQTFIPVLKRLRKELRDYDIVHVQYGSGCGFLSSFVKGSKILSLRGSDWYISARSNSWQEYIHTRISVLLTHISLWRYDKVITMSVRMENELIKRFPFLESKVETITDGINLSKFQQRDRYAERLAAFGLDDRSPWVLFSSVDNNNPLKRHYLADKAFSIAKQSVPTLKMKFMNNIDHDDVPSFISCSNVIILTSTHEGWPNIIKEGLALNIPFVSTNVSDLKSIADVEKSCTVVDEVTDEHKFATKLAAGILQAINNEKKDLRKYVEDMRLDSTIRKIVTVYKDILE